MRISIEFLFFISRLWLKKICSSDFSEYIIRIWGFKTKNSRNFFLLTIWMKKKTLLTWTSFGMYIKYEINSFYRSGIWKKYGTCRSTVQKRHILVILLILILKSLPSNYNHRVWNCYCKNNNNNHLFLLWDIIQSIGTVIKKKNQTIQHNGDTKRTFLKYNYTKNY